ncbi:MAG TPA: glycoside hydrolase family 172 protein [Polyangiales bacterium]|nr:glycoside hydrolase family 172 protein [Polyangiales bacterium]
MRNKLWVFSIPGLLCLSTSCATAPSEPDPPAEAVALPPSAPYLRMGLEAFEHFDELPILKTGARSGNFSSAAWSDATVVSEAFDPNDDYSNYVARTESERVLFDVMGSGVIYRFWHTDDAMDAWAPGGSRTSGSDIDYDLYFDDEPTPRQRLHGPELWSGRLASFEAPLALDATASGGGVVSYRPISFAKRLRIVASAREFPAHDYYGIDYHLYPRHSAASYRPGQDSSAARARLVAAGENPIAPSPEDSIDQLRGDLPGGATWNLGHWTGPTLITELVLQFPELRREEYPALRDHGRATRGSVAFDLAIPAMHSAVRLVRRLDAGRAQRGDVFIDGQPAGRWSTSKLGDPYQPTRAVLAWLESSFELPPALTAGKTRVRVRIDAAEGDEWNEFRYWARTRTGGLETQSDELDIGDPASERAHAYTISDPVWTGTQTFRPIEPKVIEGRNDGRALADVRLQMFWDDETTPSVDVPVAEFFGTGAGFLAEVRALPVGHRQGRFYCYFPLPFARSARIAMVSPAGTPALTGIEATVRRRPYDMDFEHVGQFHAERRSVASTSVGLDYEILTVSGQGHYVGTNLILPIASWTLEGDEHIFVDGSRTPAIAGTGTEDYFNGAWYFSRGPFSAPMSGLPELATSSHALSAYRFHITDYVAFRTGLRVAIEHDGINSNQLPYASVAYYYLNPAPGMREVDQLEPAEPASAAAHGYLSDADARTQMLSARFLSESQTRSLASTSGSARFQLAIDRTNAGIVLRRQFDQSVRDQLADVYVDGALAGRWYSAGGNDAIRWREDEFWIPAELTRERDVLDVRLQVVHGPWNAAEYRAFALRDVGAF